MQYVIRLGEVLDEKKIETLKLMLEDHLGERTTNLRDRRIAEASSESPSESGVFSSHPADVSGDSIERERSIFRLSRESDVVSKIEAALDRIKKGTYAICELCGDEISYSRLLAKPYAWLCIQCQEKTEN